MIWLIGDSIVEDAVREFAGDEEFVSTAIPEATQEQVWTEQKHYGRRRWTTIPTVVCFINSLNYDSEATMWHVVTSVPIGSKVLFLYLPGGDVRAGLDHYTDPLLVPLEISSTDKNVVLEVLNESR
jgi:hypothetical protein